MQLIGLLIGVSPSAPKHWLSEARESETSVYTSVSHSTSASDTTVAGTFTSYFLQSSQNFSSNEIEGAFSHIHFETGLRFITSRDAQRKARYSDRACSFVCLSVSLILKRVSIHSMR